MKVKLGEGRNDEPPAGNGLNVRGDLHSWWIDAAVPMTVIEPIDLPGAIMRRWVIECL